MKNALVVLTLSLFLNACGVDAYLLLGNGSSGSSGGSDNNGSAGIPSGPVTLTCEEYQFVVLINMYRTQNGRVALVVSQTATDSTRWMSHDMGEKSYFSHTDSLGRSPFQRAPAFGFQYSTGENIAAGNSTASATFCQWKNSSGHNTNMLNSGHRSMGIGFALVQSSPYGYYWTNLFGAGSDDTISAVPPSGCSTPSSLPSC